MMKCDRCGERAIILHSRGGKSYEVCAECNDLLRLKSKAAVDEVYEDFFPNPRRDFSRFVAERKEDKP